MERATFKCILVNDKEKLHELKDLCMFHSACKIKCTMFRITKYLYQYLLYAYSINL
jgi:hypothetical protein